MYKIVLIDGIFIIGKPDDKQRFIQPRTVTFIDEGKRIQMSPLPGWPEYIFIPPGRLSYVVNVEDKATVDLYERLTCPPKQ